jgi:hypothetical protein
VESEKLVRVGVDTHADVHVAAVLDQAGRLLETATFVWPAGVTHRACCRRAGCRAAPHQCQGG